MNILHIASHKGNIGDMINHEGFYRQFSNVLSGCSIDKVELRDFYYSAKNRKFYNNQFADIINSYDMCIIGGGGYFDVQWSQSETGSTLDFSEEFIQTIKIPVLINAIGYHEYPGITNKETCDKFFAFLNLINRLNNWLVTVRNDGSYERILDRYGYYVSNCILKVPDNGFYYQFPIYDSKIIKKNVVGMCITNELFCKSYNNEISYNYFNKIISNFINWLYENSYNIILFPHTPNDINTINELFKEISDEVKRNGIIVAPYDSNSCKAIVQLGKYYSECKCIIGMRFHSVITGINLRIPTIALAGHQQIEDLYKDLGLLDYCIKVDSFDIVSRLQSIFLKTVSDKNSIISKYKLIYENLNKYERIYNNTVVDFLANHNIC